MSIWTLRGTAPIAIMAAAAALLVTSCSSSADSGGSDGEIKTKVPGTLTVAVLNSPPEVIVEPDGTLSGIEGEIITKFAEENHLRLQPFATSFAGKLTAVQTGRADIGLQAYYTPDRAKAVYFTDALRNDPTGVATSPDLDYEKPDSLQGKKIATVHGSTGVPFMQKQFGKDNIALFDSYTDAEQALISGQVDAFTAGVQVFPFASQHDLPVHEFTEAEEKVFGPDGTEHMYTSCDNKALADSVSAFIKKLSDSGELEEIYADNYSEPDRLTTKIAPGGPDRCPAA